MYVRTTPRAQQGRHGRPLPAARAQHLGPREEALAHRGALQLRSRGRREPGRAGAPRGLAARFLSSAPEDPQGSLFAAAAGLRLPRRASPRRQLRPRRPLATARDRRGPAPTAGGKRRDAAAERVLFALTANRALAPSSKLAAARWACEDACIEALPATTDDACYRAMDWLLRGPGRRSRGRSSTPSPASSASRSTCSSSTPPRPTSSATRPTNPWPATNAGELLVAGTEQEAVRRAGFRSYGHSKDHRPDLPQVVVGMAVTREGIPVRVWSLARQHLRLGPHPPGQRRPP